jgi:hypothetical protein
VFGERLVEVLLGVADHFDISTSISKPQYDGTMTS